MLGRLAGWPVGFVRPTGRPVDRVRPALTGFFRTFVPGTLILYTFSGWVQPCPFIVFFCFFELGPTLPFYSDGVFLYFQKL